MGREFHQTGLRRPKRPAGGPSAPTPIGGWDPFTRILRQEARQQSAGQTSASATACRAFSEFETHRTRDGAERGAACATQGASDLIKALAGEAYWRGPADATWQRVSSRAGRPTATTGVTLTQSAVLYRPAGIRLYSPVGQEVAFAPVPSAERPRGSGRNLNLCAWVPAPAGPVGLPSVALRSASNLGSFPR